MLVQLTRWFWGSARFRVEGSAERFFNHCARRGITLWGMQAGESPGAWVRAGQYPELLACAHSARCRLRVEEKRGLPFRTWWLRRRKGLVFGAFLGVLILSVLSQQIWCVQAEGLETITRRELDAACREIGLVPGAWKSKVDPLQAERQLMLRFPNVSWLTVNTQGCAAYIKLAEGVEKPDMETWKKPGNVKADVSGQILRIEVFAGEAQVNEGDAVTAGQLLISGVVEDTFGNVTLRHASGRIFASTVREFTAEVPMTETVQIATGQTLTRRCAELFGLRLPLTLSSEPGEGWEKQAVRTVLSANGIELPVAWLEETWTETIGEERLLSPEEALAVARAQAEEQKSRLKSLVILSEEETVTEENGVLYYTLRAECEEDIAVETEILVNSPN